MSDSDIKRLGPKYKLVDWFFFSVNEWKILWQDPYWYTSLILEFGFLGFTIAAFISILQIESRISRVWIYWICYLIQTFFLSLHTFIYGFYRINKVWADTSIHHAGRINYSLGIMWMTIIFSLAMISHFISLPEIPKCCTQEIPGLTTSPINVLLTVEWYMIATILFTLNFGASAANFIAIKSIMYPEKKISGKEFHTTIKRNSTRIDKEDKKHLFEYNNSNYRK